MKETLEEAALKHAKLEKIDSDERYYQTHKCEIHDTFIQGAKWQAERMCKELNTESQEYGLLQHIKMCLDCNNESQAIRILEKYGFEKQENMYSEEEVLQLLEGIQNQVSIDYNDEFMFAEEWLKQHKKK